MGANEIKAEKIFSCEKTADFLRALADALTGRSTQPLEAFGLSLSDANKIKIGMKRQENGFDIKVKIKRPDVHAVGEDKEAADGGSETLTFKALKKRMKKSFARIGETIKKNQLPTPEDMASHLAAAEDMVSLYGKGDKRYDDYRALCTRFQEIVAHGDIGQVARTYKKLRDQKKACHDHFK